MREEAVAILTEVGVDALIGTMIEVPRAALTAGQIAASADFISFGTNDLTQMGWGFSRDDVEASIFSRYLDLGIFGVSPFESIDREGVGRLLRIATDESRAARSGLKVGVCGEHGGDPDSVHFFHAAGLDYVSLLALPGAGGAARGGTRRRRPAEPGPLTAVLAPVDVRAVSQVAGSRGPARTTIQAELSLLQPRAPRMA